MNDPTLRVAMLAVPVALGIGDAVLVHRAGRPWSSALLAGAVMTVFLAWGVRRVRRFLGKRLPDERQEPGAPVRGWANPSRSQRLTERVRRWFASGPRSGGR